MSIDEEWRPVSGYEGFYSISSLGRVRSEGRVIYGQKKQSVQERIMAPASKKSGHLSVMLYGPERRRLHVHRMVMLAFVGPPPSPLHEVAHNDGCPSNNVLANLRWDTRSGNHGDKVTHGTHNRGEAHPLCSISDETVRRIRESTSKSADIASEYGISYAHVRAIKTGTARKYL